MEIRQLKQDKAILVHCSADAEVWGGRSDIVALCCTAVIQEMER